MGSPRKEEEEQKDTEKIQVSDNVGSVSNLEKYCAKKSVIKKTRGYGE